MKKALFTFILFSLSLFAKAQFFGWGFDDDFFGPSQQVYAEAEYDGSESDMESFLKSNFVNPPNQREVNGTIVVTCIIDEDGNVVDTQLARGLKKSFDKEALRVAALMKFKPVAGYNPDINNSNGGITDEEGSTDTGGSTEGSTNGNYSSGNSRYDNDTGGSTRDNDTRYYSNRNNRRNNRTQRETRRQYSVSFPIKRGKLNFLNLETIEI